MNFNSRSVWKVLKGTKYSFIAMETNDMIHKGVSVWIND